MKNQSIQHQMECLGTALLLTSATVSAITVDGIRSGGEGYTAALADQATISNWNAAGVSNDEHEALANIYAAQDGNDLALHIAARVKDRGIILFIDSKAGGKNIITNDLITFGGEENYINNLGTDGSNGMTFESGFEADYAIRIYGDGASGAFVNIYNLTAGTRIEAGNAGAGDVSKGIISLMRANNLGAGAINASTGDYAAAVDGVEMKLDLAALGVLPGSQTVNLMAVLVNGDSTYGSNQVLGSRTTTTSDIAGAINSIDFESAGEPEIQTLSFGVTGPDSRNVVFSVDMTGEISNGFFNTGTDRVKVLFFSGSASPTPGEIFLTDDNADMIYDAMLVTEGTEATDFGTYKFFNTSGSAPNGGFEYGDDRNFSLAALNTTQILPTVVFRPNSFSIWSNSFSGGGSPTDDTDGDGMANAVEYFMGANASAFTPNPQAVADVVTWPRNPYNIGTTFKLLSSDNLSTWTDVTGAANLSDPNSVEYTIPSGDPKRFIRLEVTVP